DKCIGMFRLPSRGTVRVHHPDPPGKLDATSRHLWRCVRPDFRDSGAWFSTTAWADHGPRDLSPAPRRGIDVPSRCPVPLSPADVTKQIKAANDIVDVLASYLGPVHAAGKLFKAICPFHQDTRPSLQIDRHWQNYHCWACGAKGDVLTFVEKYEKVTFKE